MLHLGAFQLDPASGELSRAGRRVHLTGQSARLLVLLASRAPHVVSRDEIRRALWGDDLHVEFDAAVNACISQIRSALGDSARAPRFIETVPRQGYRCLATQTLSGTHEPEPAPAPMPGSPSRSRTSISAAGWRFLPMSLLLALALATGVLVSLAGSPRRPLLSPNLVAMQKYERGISGLADASPGDLSARVKHFETAIAADPDFAAAYAGLAAAKLMMAAYRVEPAPVAYAAAKAAAQTALSIDPRLADAHATFGVAVLHFEWDWKLAERHLRRAVSIDPQSARVQMWWSRYLTAAGRHEDAITAARLAVTLAPGSPSALTQLGLANYYARRPDRARASCGEAVAIMPEFVPARACVDAAAADIGSPNLLLVPAVALVRVGDRERALDWLQRAANHRSDSLISAAVEPAFEVLHGDPRFTGVLKRIGVRRSGIAAY